MNNNVPSSYEDYQSHLQKIADIKYAAAVLQWDQETYMPAKGAAHRAQQVATLNEMAHDMFTNKRTGALLQELLTEDLDVLQRKNVELSYEDYARLSRFSPGFVRQMSEAASACFYAWIDARRQNTFAIFEPSLSALVAIKRQQADMLGYTGHPYNALMDEFEKGATTGMIDKIFEDIKQPLTTLLNEIQSLPGTDSEFLYQIFPKQAQWDWGMYMASQLGFDFEAGRQDISEHPFTTSFSSHDVRITTRIDEQNFVNMNWSTIHEVGHGLYEQGLPATQYGLPLGEYASLSIHESQSRLWENCVGRSKPFWQFYYPKLQEKFPQQLSHISLQNFLQAINKVQPSLIRTEADELTYHFHIMIRYELEKVLIDGSMQTKHIPQYWNEHYKKYLGVHVPGDRHGCLQDIHWSHGSFGYFTTYSLGSFYAAQFWEQANIDVPGLQNEMATSGSTSRLLSWLRDKIHAHGRFYTSNELCAAITGKPLDSTVFVKYLRNKLLNTNIGQS